MRRALFPLALALAAILPVRPSSARANTYTFDLPYDLLTPVRDAILSEIDGRVGPGMLGGIHSLDQDEDLHFQLQVPSFQSPIVCELMNAKSILPTSAPRDWHARWKPFFDARASIKVRGGFRIWPDHPAVTASTSEGSATSNPAHVVELHPVAAVIHAGVIDDTRATIAPITLNGHEYRYKDASQWAALLRRTIRTRIVTKGVKQYLHFETPEIGYNYWRIRLQVAEAPAAAPQGHRFGARVVTPTRVYTEITHCFTVDGTQADRDVGSLQVGQTLPVVAIGRCDLAKLLSQPTCSGPLPVRFCVLGVNPPNLPEPERRRAAAVRLTTW